MTVYSPQVTGSLVPGSTRIQAKGTLLWDVPAHKMAVEILGHVQHGKTWDLLFESTLDLTNMFWDDHFRMKESVHGVVCEAFGPAGMTAVYSVRDIFATQSQFPQPALLSKAPTFTSSQSAVLRWTEQPFP